MNAKAPQLTLAEFIAANLDATTNDAGRALTEHTMRVTVHDDGAVELVVFPTGFDYKAQSFGVQGNALLAADQLNAWRSSMAITKNEEALAAAEAANRSSQGGAPVITGTPSGESVAHPALGGAA